LLQGLGDAVASGIEDGLSQLPLGGQRSLCCGIEQSLGQEQGQQGQQQQY